MNYAALNNIRRKKGFTCEEWRQDPEFIKIFDQVANDIFAYLKGKGLFRTHTQKPLSNEMDDIRQQLEVSFVEFYNKFIEGDDNYLFPPTYGPLLAHNRHPCMRFFLAACGKGIKTYSTPHDALIAKLNTEAQDFYEEREARLQAEKEFNLRTYFEFLFDEKGLGLSIDDEFGPELAFWWLGYNYSDISVLFKAHGAKASISTVTRRMKRNFEEIERKYGIEKRELKKQRNESLRKELRKPSAT